MSSIAGNPILRPHIQAFREQGTLAGSGATREEIPREAVPQVKAQLTQQMDQVVFADNTPADGNPEPGKVSQEEPSMGLDVKAEFVGNTSVGEIALDLVTSDMNSSAYAEFTSDGATIIQSISMGEKPGFVGVHLDYNGGQSYLEKLDLPEGMSLGL